MTRSRLGAMFAKTAWLMMVPAFALATGCGADSTSAAEGAIGQTSSAAVTCATGAYSFSYGGANYSYLLKVPAAPTGKLVVGLHGGGGSNTAYLSQWKLGELSDEMNFIALAPNGHRALVGFLWNSGHCCGSAVENDKDSVGYLTALIGQVQAACGITQTYVTGHSNGGMMANRLQEASTLAIDGIAPFSSTTGISRPSGITWEMSAVNVPRVVYTHGVLDTNVNFYGGETSADGVELGRIDISFKDSRKLFARLACVHPSVKKHYDAYTEWFHTNLDGSKQMYFRSVDQWEHSAESLDLAYPTGAKGALKDALALLGV